MIIDFDKTNAQTYNTSQVLVCFRGNFIFEIAIYKHGFDVSVLNEAFEIQTSKQQFSQ